MSQKKIAFFFGAGAEINVFNLPSGYNFLQESIFNVTRIQEYTKALNKIFKDEYYKGSYRYRQDKIGLPDTIAQKLYINIIENRIDDHLIEEFSVELAATLTDTEIKEISDNIGREIILKENRGNKELKNKIIKEFKAILKNKINKYRMIENSLLKAIIDKDDQDNILLDFHQGISGLLDSYFYTINDPGRYGIVKFSRIFNYYWSCYFLIMEGVVKYLVKNNPKLKQYLKDNHLNLAKVLTEINVFTQDVYSAVVDLGESYYHYISQCLQEKSYLCEAVITTNYFRFIEEIKEAKEHIYLNGELRLFEYPELLEVVSGADIDVSSKNIFFPFIFGQSFVKPIIDKEQIINFNKFNDTLNEIDLLVILGYNINEDDNHINSFLHSFVKTKKLLIVSDKDKEKQETARKLKTNHQNIDHLKVDYNDNIETIVSDIFKKIDSYN